MKYNKYIFQYTITIAVIYTVIIFISNTTFAGQNQKHVDEDEMHTVDVQDNESDQIELTDEQIIDFGVKSEIAESADLAVEVVLPGEIRLNEETMAHIAPRYPGIVKAVNKRLGDKIEEGEVLAILESIETLVEFELKSLVAGTIIEKHITLGESLETGDTAFLVADLSEVWADISVYQKDLPHIYTGQKVIITAGHGIEAATAEIHYLGPIVSEETRNGLARVFLPNFDGRWKPGMFITALVKTKTITVPLAVKKSALQQLDNRQVIFVENSNGFVIRKVTTGRSDLIFVEILSGLERGETYVSERSFVLKAQKLKDTMDPEAGHAH